jgi:uncharacterized membrane protein YoaK (UPF0700 family)
MKSFLGLVAIVASLFAATIISSQIIIPILNGIPRAIKAKKINTIPKLLFAPILWALILFFLFRFTISELPDYKLYIFAGFAMGVIPILVHSLKGGKDIDADLKDSYDLNQKQDKE